VQMQEEKSKPERIDPQVRSHIQKTAAPCGFLQVSGCVFIFEQSVDEINSESIKIDRHVPPAAGKSYSRALR